MTNIFVNVVNIVRSIKKIILNICPLQNIKIGQKIKKSKLLLLSSLFVNVEIIISLDKVFIDIKKLVLSLKKQ